MVQGGKITRLIGLPAEPHSGMRRKAHPAMHRLFFFFEQCQRPRSFLDDITPLWSRPDPGCPLLALYADGHVSIADCCSQLPRRRSASVSYLGVPQRIGKLAVISIWECYLQNNFVHDDMRDDMMKWSFVEHEVQRMPPAFYVTYCKVTIYHAISGHALGGACFRVQRTTMS